jgi:hypothetical protein
MSRSLGLQTSNLWSEKAEQRWKREAEGMNQCLFECIVPDQNPSHATHIP